MILRFLGLFLALLSLSACVSLFGEEAPPSAAYASAPVEPGERVTPRKGDTVYSLSKRYGVQMRDVIALNRLQPPYTISPSTSLLLPAKTLMQTSSRKFMNFNQPQAAPVPAVESKILPPPQPMEHKAAEPVKEEKASAAKPEETVYPEANQAAMHEVSKEVAGVEAVELAPPAARKGASPVKTPLSKKGVKPKAEKESGRFIWPVQGTVVTSFGKKASGTRNDGINISAPRGTPVAAADEGSVVYAGADIPGYGNVVILRHSGDYMTTYAHLERMFVAKDGEVAKGDVIGTVGTTGGLVTPQLHFEIRRKSDPLDPKKYLASR